MESIDSIFGPSAAAANSAAKPRNELGQDDFIRLMVAQLNHQDPTNPLENAEFLGQMAQFSMVSGIEELGSSFKGIVSNLFTSQAMMAAQLIEREVLVEAGATLRSFHTEGELLSGGFLTEAVTTDARVSVYNGSGELMTTMSYGTVDPGSHQFTWNGRNKSGGDAATGTYLVVAEGYVEGQRRTLMMQQYSTVASVTVDRANSAVRLHLDNGESVAFSQVNEFK